MDRKWDRDQKWNRDWDRKLDWHRDKKWDRDRDRKWNQDKDFDWAGTLRYTERLHKEGNEVVLVHVAEQVVTGKHGFRPGLAVSAEEWKKMHLGAEQKILDLGEEYQKQLTQLKIKNKYRSAHGQPGPHICDVVKDENADVVIMGTRGLGTMRRTIMGSVSDYVLHHSHSPVAICRYS